ncbi:MAG: sulfite exporter TauE/SafE family protein, partial [Bradyrhizobium sp.]|nr:sulfite exporter TauE/SafE family protein [Bradyrhizobium sp.]
NWTVLFTALCLQAGMGLVRLDVVWLAAIAFPATVTGAWLGARAYRALSDRNFRDLVLGLLFLSGVGLVWSSLGVK